MAEIEKRKELACWKRRMDPVTRAFNATHEARRARTEAIMYVARYQHRRSEYEIATELRERHRKRYPNVVISWRTVCRWVQLAKRMFRARYTCRNLEEQKYDILAEIDSIMRHPRCSLGMSLACIKVKIRLLGLDAPIKIETRAAVDVHHTHELRVLVDVAKSNAKVREALCKIQEELSGGRQVAELQ